MDLKDDTIYTKPIHKVMDTHKLILSNDIIKPNCNFTFFRDSLNQKSMLDFFLISDTLVTNLKDNKMRDDLFNLSDHLPICMTLQLGTKIGGGGGGGTALPPRVTAIRDNKGQRLRWDHTHLFNYYNAMHPSLAPLFNMASKCYNMLLNSGSDDPVDICRNNIENVKPSAAKTVECVYNGIVQALTTNAAVHIPSVAPHSIKHWWSSDIGNLKKSTQISFSRWRAANKPTTGDLYEKYKSDKKTFRLAVKKRKNEVRNNINHSLLMALNSSTDLWALWKNKLGKKKIPECVSGATEAGEIAAAFAVHFSGACSNNSIVRSDELLQEFINAKTVYKSNDNLFNYVLTVDIVDKAIAKLRLGKSPGADSLSGEHLKHAHPILISLLTKLFNIMILIEYVPDAFGISTIVPVPKAGKPINMVEGYRGISLTPVISKIFEQGLLIIFQPFLQTSERQFGFKTGTGCTSAIYAVRQTIEYFVKKTSTVTVCSLDMEKAFDKMNRHALFIKMMNRGCPLTLINLIDGWFKKSVACVRWGEGMSDQFTVNSGTRQGGVLSPALFAVFVNDLLLRLEESNRGCFVHNVCFNAFLYADDLILISLSLQDMDILLDICKNELAWLDMRVNVGKSSAM